MTEASEPLAITLLSTQEQLHSLIDAGETALQLSDEGIIAWGSTPVARLQKGETLLQPQLASMATLDDTHTSTLLNHVSAWLQRFIDKHLQTLIVLQKATDLTANAQAVATALSQKLGTTARETLRDTVKALTPEERAALRALGVRFGEYGVFMRDLLRPAAVRLKVILHAVHLGETPPLAPPAGVAAPAVSGTEPAWYWELCGYRVCGTRAVRCDMIEKLADAVRPLTKRSDENPKGEFAVTPEMMSFIGRSGTEFAAVLHAMGYQSRIEDAAPASPEAEAAVAEADTVVAEDVAPVAEATEAASDATETAPAAAPTTPEAPASKVLWMRKPLRAPRPARSNPPRREFGGGNPEPRADAPRRDRGANMPRFFQQRSDNADGTPQTPTTQSPQRAGKTDARPQRPIDPDNPFAVLASYKNK